MRHTIAGLLLVLGPGLAAGQERAPDAVEIDGDVHRVVIDNEHVRVFDARAPAGTKSPLHSHPPMVLVTLGKGRFRITRADGQVVLYDMNPGQVTWLGERAQHGWELLAGELHAIGVEVKSAQGAHAPPQPPVRAPDDSTLVDPDVHHVLFENAHVRVYEGRTSAGRSSPMHSHPPALLVSEDWIRLKLTLADGSQAIRDFHPYQVLWLPEGRQHSWETIAGSGRVIAIEVKSAQAASAPR